MAHIPGPVRWEEDLGLAILSLSIHATPSAVAGPFAAGLAPSFPIVTALRAGNSSLPVGTLLMISWRATSSDLKLNLSQGPQIVVNSSVKTTATQLSGVP